MTACLACGGEAGPTGSANISLVVHSPEQVVDAVNFEMLCETGDIIADDFSRVAEALAPTWHTALDLPTGQCDALITAVGADGSPICGGGLRFPVEQGRTTSPFVTLDCSQADADPSTAAAGQAAADGSAGDEGSSSSGGSVSNGGGANAQAGLGAAVLDTDLADLDGVEDPDLVDFDDVTLNLCAVVVVGFRDLAGVGVGVFIDNSDGDQNITVVTDETCLHESATTGDQDVSGDGGSSVGPEVSCDTVNCDDGNDCTTDSCSDGICRNVPVTTVAECDGGAGICLGAICIPQASTP